MAVTGRMAYEKELFPICRAVECELFRRCHLHGTSRYDTNYINHNSQ